MKILFPEPSKRSDENSTISPKRSNSKQPIENSYYFFKIPTPNNKYFPRLFGIVYPLTPIFLYFLNNQRPNENSFTLSEAFNATIPRASTTGARYTTIYDKTRTIYFLLEYSSTHILLIKCH